MRYFVTSPMTENYLYSISQKALYALAAKHGIKPASRKEMIDKLVAVTTKTENVNRYWFD